MSNMDELQKIVTANMGKIKNGRRDLCSVYHNPDELKSLISTLADPFRGKADYVAAPDPMGFLIGAFLAAELGVGFIPIRNGSIAVLADEDAIRAAYIDHNDCARSLQVRRTNIPAGSRILLTDDWVETGVTMQACMSILDDAGAKAVGIAAFGANYNQNNAKMIDNGFLKSIVCN